MSNSRDFQTAKMLPFQSGFCTVWLTWLLMLFHRLTSLEVQIRTYQDAALKTSGILLFHSFTGCDIREHVKRAAYEAGCIWSQPETQNPADWGWTLQGDVWQIFSTSNLPIAESCQQLNGC